MSNSEPHHPFVGIVSFLLLSLRSNMNVHLLFLYQYTLAICITKQSQLIKIYFMILKNIDLGWTQLDIYSAFYWAPS